MIVKLLTELHLEFLSLKGDCRGSSESTHFKMPHCWKSHALAHMVVWAIRLRAKKGPAPPPLGNFADISYLEENFKPHPLRDVCTLCSGALVSDSLLHMLLSHSKEKIKMKV